MIGLLFSVNIVGYGLPFLFIYIYVFFFSSFSSEINDMLFFDRKTLRKNDAFFLFKLLEFCIFLNTLLNIYGEK